MSAIGLFVLRVLIARPLVERVTGTSLRAVSTAFAIAASFGLVAIPVYLDFATANDSLRSLFDVGSLVPLFHPSKEHGHVAIAQAAIATSTKIVLKRKRNQRRWE